MHNVLHPQAGKSANVATVKYAVNVRHCGFINACCLECCRHIGVKALRVNCHKLLHGMRSHVSGSVAVFHVYLVLEFIHCGGSVAMPEAVKSNLCGYLFALFIQTVHIAYQPTLIPALCVIQIVVKRSLEPALVNTFICSGLSYHAVKGFHAVLEVYKLEFLFIGRLFLYTQSKVSYALSKFGFVCDKALVIAIA